MTVTCAVCHTEQQVLSVGQAVCSCGSRCFEWEDGTEKPRVSYEHPKWGAQMSESA